MNELRAIIRAKDLELSQKEEDLKLSQQKRETLIHEMAEIREEIERVQKKIEALLHERGSLEGDIRTKEVEIEILRLKNSSIVTAKEQEHADYQKQLESLRQDLAAEKRRISFLQTELQKKAMEVAEKMKDIQYLTEARERANFELEKERDRAKMKSELAARNPAVDRYNNPLRFISRVIPLASL